MSITPMEIDILGRNEGFFENEQIESRREYILRKRRADLVSVVQKVLSDELDDDERRVLLGMEAENKCASFFCDEMNLTTTQIYRIRDRAEKKVSQILKYIMLYRDDYEAKTIAPIEFRNLLSLANLRMSKSSSIVHRLKKLMAQECIGIEMLYSTPGLDKKSVDEIFCGKRVPNVQEIIIFSAFFGASADYLLKGDTVCRNH